MYRYNKFHKNRFSPLRRRDRVNGAAKPLFIPGAKTAGEPRAGSPKARGPWGAADAIF